MEAKTNVVVVQVPAQVPAKDKMMFCGRASRRTL